jgi:hypothetical protein
MGYGDDRGQRGDGWRGGERERGSYRHGGHGRDDDRGFFERAGDEVRSWFSDEDSERGQHRDSRHETERYHRNNGWGNDSFGGGWGNQEARSWNRDRPGERENRYGGSGRGYGRESYGRRQDEDWRGERSGGSRSQDRGGGGNERYGAGASDNSSGGYGIGSDGNYGGSTGWEGQRFDRVDPGQTGTHGTHPIASPFGDADSGGYGGGGFRSSARRREIVNQSSGQGGGQQDPHYSQWRSRQLEQLDRDYEEYCRECESRFEDDFSAWRGRRNEQRQSLGKVKEKMEVVGSDGQHVGAVDKVRGEHIVLTKSDDNAGGVHHSIPCSWIQRVEDKVIINRSREQAMREWQEEDRNRALFEREDSGSEGPHMLNRSFSGTYND